MNSHIISIEDSIKNFIIEIRKDNPEHNFALGIVTTSFDFKNAYFSFPRKIESWGYYFHIVCPSSEEANNILANMNKFIDVFFLDMELKKVEFCPKKIKDQNPKIKFRYLYPNDLTIQSCIDMIDFDKNESIYIFGHGNLAFNLVQRLDNKKMRVRWSPSRVSSSKNYNKLKNLYPQLEALSINKEFSLLLNISPYKSSFYKTLINFPNLKIIDVAGKGSISSILKRNIDLVDISARLTNEVSFSLIGIMEG